jgi:hypothetical protein
VGGECRVGNVVDIHKTGNKAKRLTDKKERRPSLYSATLYTIKPSAETKAWRGASFVLRLFVSEREARRPDVGSAAYMQIELVTLGLAYRIKQDI